MLCNGPKKAVMGAHRSTGEMMNSWAPIGIKLACLPFLCTMRCLNLTVEKDADQ
jgi:hypothetical protein